MVRRTFSLLTLAGIVASAVARAEPPRVHFAGGAAHAAFGEQSREFGAGGGGSASIEVPLAGGLGVQGSAGGMALGKGERPADAGLAPTGTGVVFLGTAGLRFRFFGSARVAGPWIDVNGGMSATGNLVRPAADAHLGWDFRVSRSSNWDVGPFVGYTQIVQPENELRTGDARIAWAGIQVSLGGPARPMGPPPQAEPASEPPRDRDGSLEAYDACPRDLENAPDECRPSLIRLVLDEDTQERIHLDDLIHFEFDRARIRPQSYGIVRELAKFLRSHSDIVEVSIEGHADARGAEDYNKQLSEARAASVRALLVQFGADGSRLQVVGHGKSRPQVATDKADPRNRRVEFFVKRRRNQATSGTPAGTRGRQ